MNNKKLLWLPLLALLAFSAHADNKPYKNFGGYKVFYSSFNSSFILPEIASTYNITRGKDKGLVNIAVVRDDNVGGTTALVKGTVSNILAQQQVLTFFEVREGNTVYYLAPFEFYNEDSMTFKIQVQSDPNKPSESLSFQNKFYVDD
ncbi:MAG: DUF4426 domain-containing protein [Porticoccus sp.]|nr:DUF4426 domain-containing protein [Porticoccus sp.]MBQ0808406.1 DUF4426 domain-containing protein [Porticoccus sp.]